MVGLSNQSNSYAVARNTIMLKEKSELKINMLDTDLPSCAIVHGKNRVWTLYRQENNQGGKKRKCLFIERFCYLTVILRRKTEHHIILYPNWKYTWLNSAVCANKFSYQKK